MSIRVASGIFKQTNKYNYNQNTHTHIHIHTEGAGRQTDKQIDRQTDMHT